MTTSVQRDWKVTPGYRTLLRIGWAVIAIAIYFATAASVLDSVGVWWIVAGLAMAVILLLSVLPEPVPRDLITGPKNWIDCYSSVPSTADGRPPNPFSSSVEPDLDSALVPDP